jgi:YidC/Oxa1 family membrane protein insertase
MMNIFSPIFNAFHVLLFVPMINLLVILYHGINLVHIPYALGFAIIILTIIIRLVLYPLTSSQIKASKKMMELNPHLSRLKEKHKNDAKTLQAETMKLYKEHGVNPAAGCLPLLIQMPLIIALYQALYQIVKPGAANLAQINHMLYSSSLKLISSWDVTFFTLPLAQTPQKMFSLSNSTTWLIILVPILTGVFQLIQSKMMLSAAPLPVDKKLATVKKDEKSKDDFSSAMQTQMTYLMPVMIAYFAFIMPIGLALYWNTFTIFGIIQQYRISGLGGLKEWTSKIYGGI